MVVRSAAGGAMQDVRVARGERKATRSSRGAPAACPSRAWLLPLVLLVGAASAILKDLPDGYRVLHANVVLRHGERTRLLKTTGEGEFGISDDVVLTTKGEQDCYNLGAQLRERYMPVISEDEVTTTIDGLTLWYDADRVQFEASGYDRTIESATAVGYGMYPLGQTDPDVGNNSLIIENQIVFPVHSTDPKNDPYILGFDKCPVYNQNWIESYTDDWFVELQDQATARQDEGETDDYVTQVFNLFQFFQSGNKAPICFVEAKELFQHKLEEHAPYNLWDCAKTALAEGDTTAVDIIQEAGVPPEGLSALGLDTSIDHEFQGYHYLEHLVHTIEDRKYQQKVAGRMAGGLYITALNQRFKEVVEHENSRSTEVGDTGRLPGMHISAGHYGTLKGIAAALDLGGLEGIPEYTSHLTFELLYNENAAVIGDDPYAVRILYQGGTSVGNLDFVQMGVVFDGDSSVNLDDELLAGTRDKVNGIMPFEQWMYLMEVQLGGEPAFYMSEDPEEEWCLECLATEPSACLKLELRLMTEKWEEASIRAEEAVSDKEAVDDGVGSTHVALVSVFGLILGIGVGICIKPCVDRHNQKMKASSGSVSGDRGLESWTSSAANSTTNGSFRLGAKNPSTRHVMGAVDASQMVAVPTADYDDSARGALSNGHTAYANGNGNDYDAEEDAGGSSIPSFAPTSALGEPVPFPHRRQPSGMVTGVDSSMMTGIDAEGAVGKQAGAGTTSSATTKTEAGLASAPPAEDSKEEVAQPVPDSEAS
eukprot:g14041.t1